MVLGIRSDTHEQWMVSEETKNQVRLISSVTPCRPASPQVTFSMVTALGRSGPLGVLGSSCLSHGSGRTKCAEHSRLVFSKAPGSCLPLLCVIFPFVNPAPGTQPPCPGLPVGSEAGRSTPCSELGFVPGNGLLPGGLEAVPSGVLSPSSPADTQSPV